MSCILSVRFFTISPVFLGTKELCSHQSIVSVARKKEWESKLQPENQCHFCIET